MKHTTIINHVQRWLKSIVIDLNLCPFANWELSHNRIRFFVSDATTQQQLVNDLHHELTRLEKEDAIETSLIIHPNVLTNFEDYNDFLDIADGVLIELALDGIIQIASFHPNYQFADTHPDDVENYTNRSPYPLLHLLRERSVARAIKHYPAYDKIPERNIERLKAMGSNKITTRFRALFDDDTL